jgi:GT2 family glycosyltransferase
MDVGWLSGVCLCLLRADYLAVGGFDSRFFMYAEDVALCGKLRSGKGRIVLLDRHDVLHYGGASSPNLMSRARNAVWQQRHILQVCEDEFGRGARVISTVFVAAGLLLRLGFAVLLTVRRGVKGNAGLHINWARLRDIIGLNTIPVRPQTLNQGVNQGGQHASRN